MQNKLLQILLFISIVFAFPALAEINSNADAYNPSGSMFEKITDLEQKKVLWQLEKENAQMQLDMDRMEAERTRIKNEMEAMSDEGKSKAQALELERQQFEMEKQRFESQKKNISSVQSSNKNVVTAPEPEESPIQEKYRLIEIVGAGRQLIATIEDNKTGQRKKVSVGKELDGYNVDTVSLDDGVVISKDGETQILGVHFDE